MRKRSLWVMTLLGIIAFLVAWQVNTSVGQEGTEVRIQARQLADGKVEFALQTRLLDDSWGERILPRSRFFPTEVEVGKWLSSSPLTVAHSQLPTTTTTQATDEWLVDAYWGGDYFYIHLKNLPPGSWCDVYLLNGTRRVGERDSAKVFNDGTAIFEFLMFNPPEFNNYEWVC